jgi:hypothetical protein
MTNRHKKSPQDSGPATRRFACQSAAPKATGRGCCPRGPPASAGRGPTGRPVSTDRPVTDSRCRPAAQRPTRRSRRPDGAIVGPRIAGSRPGFRASRRLTVNFGKALDGSRPHNPHNPSRLTGGTRRPPALVSRGPRPRTRPRRRHHPRKSIDRMAGDRGSKDLPISTPFSGPRGDGRVTSRLFTR